MTGNATDAAFDVGCVIEIHKVRKVMDAFPQNRIAVFKTVADRLQDRAFRMYDSQISFTASGPVSTMAVSTSRRGWNRSMSCSLDCVVAVATIKLQLPSVQLVAERHWLFGLVADVDDRWMDRSEQTGRKIATNCYCSRY